MAWEHIELAFDDPVATVTLNRPEALNALVGTMRQDLLAAIDDAAERARVVVITGAGKAFSSGGDVGFMAELREAGNDEALVPLIEAGKNVVKRLRTLPIPTLATVNGVAAGAGLGLALACDLRIAASGARFGASFARIGLHPDWGTTYSLTRLAGPAVARDLIFTGRLLDADEALELGLVSWVFEPEHLAEQARRKALALAETAPTSLRYAREAIALAENASMDDVLDFEADAQLACFRTEDALEGFRAFLQKRRPEFKGR